MLKEPSRFERPVDFFEVHFCFEFKFSCRQQGKQLLIDYFLTRELFCFLNISQGKFILNLGEFAALKDFNTNRFFFLPLNI